MDILYVIGRGSKHDNEELRFSLRSIAKNGKNIGRVFIVGYPPEFVNIDNVTIIDCGDMYKRKHKNILKCIEVAITKSDIGGESGEFLLSSDDHFYIKPTDFNNYPIYYKGELPKTVNADNKTSFSYRFSLVETRELLEKNGMPSHNFSWHGNTHFNAHFFRCHLLALAQSAYNETECGVEPTCLMLNAMYKDKPFEFVRREDNKTAEVHSRAELLDMIKDRECISVYDIGYEHGVRRYLKELFPDKCKYER